MSSILICCTPAQGHVTPLLAIAEHLASRGHDVRFITGRAYESRVTAAGIPCLLLPREGDLDLDNANTAYPERAALSGIKEVQWSMTNLFAKPAIHQVRAIDTALAEAPADVILADPLAFGAFIYAARPNAERIPVAVVSIGPLQTIDPDTAPFGFGKLPKPGAMGRFRNWMLQAATGPVFRPVVAELAKGFAAAEIAMPTDYRFGDLPSSVDAVIQLTVPSFEYPRRSLDNVHFVGPVSLGTSSALPVPSWWGELDGDRPVVHVSQGTVANDDLSQLVQPTIEALADEEVLVVVATGGAPVESLGTVPANVRVAEYLPYDRLFPKLSAFVSNGGYGGLHFALAHGVPIVASGTTEDKMATTARVEWSGAGLNLRKRRPKPAAIRAAVRRVLSEPGFHRAAERIAIDIAAAPGVAGVEPVIAELAASHGRVG